MKCNKCNVDMNNPSHQGESYYICKKCGIVEFDYNLGNTFQIEQAFTLENQLKLGKDIN